MKTILHSVVENGRIVRSFSCPCDAEYYLMQMNMGDPQNPFDGERDLKFQKIHNDWYFEVEDSYKWSENINECEMRFYERFGFTRDEVEAWQRYNKFKASEPHREIQTHEADL